MIRRNAFAFRGEVRRNPVPQHGSRQCLNVVRGNMRSSLQQSAGLGSEQKILDGTRTRAPAEPFLNPLRRTGFMNSRLANQCQGVVDDVVRHGNLTDNVLDVKNLLGREDG